MASLFQDSLFFFWNLGVFQTALVVLISGVFLEKWKQCSRLGIATRGSSARPFHLL